MSRSHKDLAVWDKARRLTYDVYRLTESFPSHENFGLRTQCRRACISIASNISEGAARQSDKEFLQFLYVARGSLAELETQIMIASDLGYLNPDAQIEQQRAEVGRMLNGLISVVRGPAANLSG